MKVRGSWTSGTLRCHGKKEVEAEYGDIQETPSLTPPFLPMPSEALASLSATGECPEIREITWTNRK